MGWGGQWTEKKLLAFEKYVKAYLKIMNKHRYKYKWKLIYLDAFAGSGSRETESPSERQQWLTDFDIEPNEFSVYKGAAERVLAIGKNEFDYYYFVDRDEKASENLQKKLFLFGITKKTYFYGNHSG